MNPIVARLLKMPVTAWRTMDAMFRARAVETLEYEETELRHIFGLLVLGSFVGLPSPPAHISLDLMPFMEPELMLMLEKIDTAHEPLSDLFSVLSID